MEREPSINASLAVTAVLALLTLLLLFLAPTPKQNGQIYLYGEEHGKPILLEEELKRWQKYYHEDGMRHLFVEYPYFGAELLNLWMRSEDDEILDEFFADIEGTQGSTAANYQFTKAIKETCPETVFHGTDVGHAYWSMGARYLEYLRENGMGDTRQYDLTLTSIEQGEHYYQEGKDGVYRELKMTENFIREYDALGGINIMGIYGDGHVMKMGNRMAEQLEKHYDGKYDIYSINISYLNHQQEPLGVETIRVGGKEYEASCFGERDISRFSTYRSCKAWRLEETGEDFERCLTSQDYMMEHVFPVELEMGDVFVLDLLGNDGSEIRKFYRYSGITTPEGLRVAEEILPD